MSNSRTYLEKGTVLHLRRENSRHSDDWTILNRIGEGGSSVCYTATTGKKQGRLKEFNPIDRSVDAGSMNSFLAAYRTLEAVKAKDTHYQVLNNYIPHYELLFSTDEEGRYTGAYIWTPDDKTGTNFSDYLQNVRRNPENNPVQTLANIIDIVYTLTDCVCLLHSAGILHLDLKPSNFLVTYNSRMELNTGNISLFDINTITSIENDSLLAVGTDGYCAPEIEQNSADNRSDIYSIGAILFNAIIMAEMIPDGLYRNEYYDSLDCLVSGSRLIRCEEANYSAALRAKLAEILRKCLAYRPDERYDYCELLMEDLLAARQLIDYKQPAGSDRRVVPEPKQKPSKHPFRTIAGILGAAAALALIAIFLGKGLNINSKPSETVTPAASEQKEVTPAVKEQTAVTPTVSEQNEQKEDTPVTDEQKEATISDARSITNSYSDSDKELVSAIREKLYTEDMHGTEREFTLDPASLGTDRLVLPISIDIYPNETLTLPKEMKLSATDWNLIKIFPRSTFILESFESIDSPFLSEDPLFAMQTNSTMQLEDITVNTGDITDGANWDYDLLQVFPHPDFVSGTRRYEFLIIGDVYFSCDYETFCDKDFYYIFLWDNLEDVDADCTPVDRCAVYFAGSDEPLEVRYRSDYKTD